MAAVLDRMEAPAAESAALMVDFMYLDLETCTRCRGTDANLDAALSQVEQLLGATGVDVSVRKTLVTSAEQAQALRFVSSPTIRVNSRDIALELRESSCAECGEACGCDGAIDCRVWVWQGQEYTQAPPAMIVDAILRAIYAGAPSAVDVAPATSAVPENLMRFFDGKAQQTVANCCSADEQASCCEPAQKASCCGDSAAGGCGCQ